MATYNQVGTYVRREYGFSIKTCWIADVKEQSGLPVRRAWNRSGEDRQNPCPLDKVESIRAAFRHFGLL